MSRAGEVSVPAGAPEGFVGHAYQKTFFVDHPIERVWPWLNDPATFVDGQVWPFRVEFVNGGFEPGVLNVHHGPFLNAAGVVGEVRGPGDEPAYRELKYFYGSYALSPRLARPTRLQFWTEEGAGGPWSRSVSTPSSAGGSCRFGTSGSGSSGPGSRVGSIPP